VTVWTFWFGIDVILMWILVIEINEFEKHTSIPRNIFYIKFKYFFYQILTGST